MIRNKILTRKVLPLMLFVIILMLNCVYAMKDESPINETETTGVFGANKTLNLNASSNLQTNKNKDKTKTNINKDSSKKNSKLEKEEEYELNLYYVIETTGISGVNDSVDIEKLEEILDKIEE
ncbi:MAG: hypothetical protein AB7V50_06990 [Vampirovibrionia bacterium]